MDKNKQVDQKSKKDKGHGKIAKKQWQKPELDELKTDQTEGGPVSGLDGGSRS